MPSGRRGQSARGAVRQAALVQAAVALVGEQGLGAVSHRAVARRAGVPLAATTYYFSSLESLLVDAVQALAAQWLDRAQAVLEQLPPQLAGPTELAEAAVAITVPVGPATDDLPTMYERYLEAGRSPALRPLVRSYDAALDDLLADVLSRAGHPRSRARLLLAVVDGAVLRALAEGDAPRAAAVAAVEELARSGLSGASMEDLPR